MADLSLPVRVGFSGTAAIGATLCVHPLDVIRVQMQLDAEGGSVSRYKGNPFTCISQIAKAKGLFRGLYSGLTAGIFRQITYGMPRLTIYTLIRKEFSVEGEEMSIWTKLAMGFTAGGLGSLCGVPSEVALVRMTADSRFPPADRRNYKNIFDALARIAKEGGVAALWSGTLPTVARACLLNAGQLGVYSEAKERIQSTAGMTGIPLQFCSSLVSGIAAVGLSCPADVLKSRMQYAGPTHSSKSLGMPGTHTRRYSGVLDCMRKTIAKEGVLALWKGSIPAYVKLAPHTIISFIIIDNLSKWYTGEEAL